MKRLKELRSLSGKTQAEVSKYIGIGRSTYTNYEIGEREPDYETLTKLSGLFDVSIDYLLGNTDDPTPPNRRGQKDGILRIPVYGTIPAGVPMEAIEDIIDVEEAPASWARGDQEYFALKIKGDSMSPKYLENDVAIFRKSPDCESGQECAVMVDGHDATFKKVLKDEQGVTLQPLNPDYAPSFYTNEEIKKLPLTILGIVKEIRRTVG